MVSHFISNSKQYCLLLLLFAFSSKTFAAWPKAQTDDQRAARLVEQALEAEVEGDSNERSRLLEEAIRISPDFAPARWQLGQVHYATKWRSLYEIERIAASNTRLAQYKQLRRQVKPDAQSHLALANWCQKYSLQDEERFHLLKVLQYKPGDKRTIQRLGLVVLNGRLISKNEIERLQVKVKQTHYKNQQWQQVISKLHRALTEGNESQQFEALRQLRSITDPAAIPALEIVFLKLTPASSFEERELRRDLIGVIGKMPQHQATLALARQAVYSSSPIIRTASIDHLKNRPLHEFVPLLIAGMTSPVRTKVDIVPNESGISYTHTFYREGLNHDRQVVRKKRYVPVEGKPLVRSEADLKKINQLIQKTNREVIRQKALARIHQKKLSQNHQRILQSLGAGGEPEGQISPQTFFRKQAEGSRGMATIVNQAQNIAAKESLYRRLEILKREANVGRLAAQEAVRVENTIEKENFKVYRSNQPYRSVLAETVGVDYGIEPGNWWRWWKNYNELYTSSKKPVYTNYFINSVGYSLPSSEIRSPLELSLSILSSSHSPFTQNSYSPISSGPHRGRYLTTRRDGTYMIRNVMSCFIAGTKIWTKTGPVAIENIQSNDRVLAQDPVTGQLTYKLVLATTVRPPDPLIKIGLGDSSITVTRGHPLWVTGHGWRMAKLLKVGDRLYSVNGSVVIDNVSPEVRQKTYNLVVEDFHTYFVGENRILVHDNNYRQPTTALVPGLARKAIW